MAGGSSSFAEFCDGIGYSDISCRIGLAAGTSGVTATRALLSNA